MLKVNTHIGNNTKFSPILQNSQMSCDLLYRFKEYKCQGLPKFKEYIEHGNFSMVI